MSNRGGLEIGLTCNQKTTWRLNIKTAAGESDAVEIFVQTINNQHGDGLPWKTIQHQIQFLRKRERDGFFKVILKRSGFVFANGVLIYICRELKTSLESRQCNVKLYLSFCLPCNARKFSHGSNLI